MATALYTHPDTLLHVMDGRHPESPARITRILQALKANGIDKKLTYIDAPVALDNQLTRVHAKDYIQHITSISPKAGLVHLDADTAMGPMTLSACLHASGAAVSAVDWVMQSKQRRAFCCTRPPGHHAGKSHAAGFCIINHVAVAVAHALEQYGLSRVAIIDFDVHHGDGTEEIFKDDSRVMLCSTFQHPFYPHRGAETRTERMINIPLQAKTDGERIRQVFETEFAPALARFSPEFIFVSAGFDAHEDDPLADLALTTKDYGWITRWIVQQSNQHCHGRVVSLLEGGYHLDSLAESVCVHVNGLI